MRRTEFTAVIPYYHGSGACIPSNVLNIPTFDTEGRACRSTVQKPLKAGYRHINTAATYRNETEEMLEV
jgi:diketogulonate reductase-like aldo/keto reductase